MQMQSQDPGISKQFYRNYENRAANQMSNRVSPGSNVNQGKSSYSPGHWKKYITSDANLKSPPRKSAQYEYNYKGNDSQTYEQLNRQYVNDRARVHETQSNKFQQQKRKKEQMMKRVQQIQKKVLPILKSQRNSEQVDQNFGWQNRMEQRILKIQTHLDSIEKQMQIKIQKRLLQVERDWTVRIQALINTSPQTKQRRPSRPSQKLNEHTKTTKTEPKKHEQQEEYYTNNQKYGTGVGQKNKQAILSKYENQVQFGNEKSEGYYTRRQNENKKKNYEQT